MNLSIWVYVCGARKVDDELKEGTRKKVKSVKVLLEQLIRVYPNEVTCMKVVNFGNAFEIDN